MTSPAWNSTSALTPTSTIPGSFSPTSATPTGNGPISFVFTPSSAAVGSLNSSAPGLTNATGALTYTATAVPSLPAGSLYARDMVGGFGLNVPFSGSNPALTSQLLGALGCRQVRMQLVEDNTGEMVALQNALVAGGYSNPNLRLNVLLNGYIQDDANNQLTEQEPLLVKLAGIHGPGGKTILHSIENINEENNPYVGQGSRGPNDTTNKTGQAPSGPAGAAANPTAFANFNDWVQQVYALRARHVELSAVPLYSPTVLDYTGAPYSGIDETGKIDAVAFHYYAGVSGTGGTPNRTDGSSSGDLSSDYNYQQTSILPGGPVAMTECGASTQNRSDGYSLRGQARYALLNWCDFYQKPNALEFYWYNAFNNPASTQSNVTTDPEDNFGLAWPDATLKPAGIVSRNFVDILSLGLNFDNASNAADTAPFAPAYDGTKFKATGISPGGGTIVAHKSDGSVVGIVWNEAPIDSGGAATSPSPNQVSVDLGDSHSWAVYDPTGGGGAVDFTASRNLAPIATGTGSTVPLTLYSSPLMIVLS